MISDDVTKHDSASFVKAARERLNLTQAELGAKIGVERRTVIRYEKGSDLPLAKLLAIKHLLASRARGKKARSTQTKGEKDE